MMKTEKQAIADVNQAYDVLCEDLRATLRAKQNDLRNRELQHGQALERVNQYFRALEKKTAADLVVDNPPNEVKESDGNDKGGA